MTDTVVLEPEVAYAAVAAAFDAWDGGPTDRHAWLAGEPIGARWTNGDDEVLYSANPAIGLRVLSGARARAAASGLAALEPERARALARSDDEQIALLGITAIGLYGDFDAGSELDALARDARPKVAAAAELALRRVGVAALELGVERIAERRRRAPDRDPVFGLVGPASTRRQLIRTIAAKPPRDRARRLELVAAALEDEDWEVRFSALIAAGELGLSELLAPIKRCPPAAQAHRVDREILEALREVVGCALAGKTPQHPGAAHLRGCLDGQTVPRDRAWMLVGALRRALPDAAAPAAPADFCVVPAILHHCGDPDVGDNQPRAVVPAATCLIAEEASEPVPAADVRRVLAARSAALGAPLRLPTALELELAVRGPDGRRHPWGNGRERRASQARSPWGLRHPLAGPEWVAHDDAPRALGPADRCAGPLHRPERAAVRPVIATG